MLTSSITVDNADRENFSRSEANLHENLTGLGAAFERLAAADQRGDAIAAGRLFFETAEHFYPNQPIDVAFDDYHAYLRERGAFISLRTDIDRLIAGVVTL